MKKLLKLLLPVLTGAVFGTGIVGKYFYEKNKVIKGNADRYLALFQMMDQWVKVKQQGKNLSEYFHKNDYSRIAIYGLGRAGIALINELKTTDITVVYGMDKRADSLFANIDILSMNDELPNVDTVIVTAVTFYDEIEEQLSAKMDCPIISLEDILLDM